MIDYRKLRQLREESERNERRDEAKRKILPKSLSVLPSSIKSQEERNAGQKESHLAFVEKRKVRQEETESKQAEQFERENRSFVGMIVSLVKSALDAIFVSYSAITEIIGTKVRSMVEETVLKGGNGAPGEVLTSGDWGLYWATVANSGLDYDKVYIGGIEYTPGANTNDYDFLQIGADGSSSWIVAMISPMPTGYEIYNIRKNHIHISGATAGNI